MNTPSHAREAAAVSPPLDRRSTYSPVTEVQDTPQALLDAREAYEVVQAAYTRATTLQQTQKAHEIYPALREAKKRLLAAEVRYG